MPVGTKKPGDPADKYVSALAGSDIQTNPPATNAAIQELKATAQEAEIGLEARLGEAERFGIELANHVTAGQQIMDKIARITSVARNGQPMEDRLAEPNKVQSALQQLSMRPRIRGNAA